MNKCLQFLESLGLLFEEDGLFLGNFNANIG